MYNQYITYVDKYFGDLLEKYKAYIINSFIMVEKHGSGKIYNSRLSNGPIESITRKVKDLKRLDRGFHYFEHFRNLFLYATRQNPVLNGVSEYNTCLSELRFHRIIIFNSFIMVEKHGYGKVYDKQTF